VPFSRQFVAVWFSFFYVSQKINISTHLELATMKLRSIYAASCVSALALAVAIATSTISSPVEAQTGASAATANTTAATTAKTIALVSAVGDQFSFVRQKQSVGSNLDPYTRQNIDVPDQTINNAVLRGLDRAMGAEFPNSRRVLLHVAHDKAAADVLPQNREAHVFKHVTTLLEGMPERQSWDEIVVVTPKWLKSESTGMGSKLVGVGIYVQPLEGTEMGADFGIGMPEDAVETVDRRKTTAKTFVAPFFYTTVTTLDAKTLKVIKRDARHDFRKIVDPDATSRDVQNAIPVDKLAGMIERFVETAALRSLTDKTGTVEIGPVKSTPSNN
jgi:hypothetical protein